MNKKVLFVGLLAGCFGMNAFAATEIYVSASTGNDSYNGASWETAYKTLQYAVASVKENEETIIYLEANTTFDTGGQLDFGENKNVTIIGENTTLRAALQAGKDGGEGARIMRAATGCNLTVKGLTFLNGRQVTYQPAGGLYFAGNTLVVDSCQFIDNESGSGGSGICARAKDVTVRNSYFDGNYVYSNYGTGAALIQAGVNNGDAGSLLVENCTFYRNDVPGAGTAISTSDAAVGYSNVESVKVVNCTFVGNTSEAVYTPDIESSVSNQGAIDVTESADATIYVINNTFYDNDGALRIGDIYKGELVMLNNLIFANGAGIFGDPSYTVANLRTPIEGYNNIIVGAE